MRLARARNRHSWLAMAALATRPVAYSPLSSDWIRTETPAFVGRVVFTRAELPLRSLYLAENAALGPTTRSSRWIISARPLMPKMAIVG